MKTEDALAYRLDVARLFRASGSQEITLFNGTMAHAQIVTEEALRAAKKRVRILVDRVASPQFDCDAVVSAADDFLMRDGNIELLVERDIDLSKSPFVRTIRRGNHKPDAIRVVPPGLREHYKFNFMTVDGNAYRYQEDRALPTAVVAGGGENARIAKHLDDIFVSIHGRATPAVLQDAEG